MIFSIYLDYSVTTVVICNIYKNTPCVIIILIPVAGRSDETGQSQQSHTTSAVYKVKAVHSICSLVPHLQYIR